VSEDLQGRRKDLFLGCPGNCMRQGANQRMGRDQLVRGPGDLMRVLAGREWWRPLVWRVWSGRDVWGRGILNSQRFTLSTKDDGLLDEVLLKERLLSPCGPTCWKRQSESVSYYKSNGSH